MSANMEKIYRLSPEAVEQLSTIETKSWSIFVIFFVVMLVAHFAISGALYLIGYLEPLTSLVMTLFLVGVLCFYLFKKPAYIHRHYSSYEIELADQAITFRQNNKPTIEIRQDEIAQIREILPEGEIYIKGKKKGQLIDVYALLLRENSNIKEELAKWQKFETASLSWIKLSQPLTMILLAFMAPILLVISFSDPNAITIGLTALGYSLIGFFVLKEWPVRDPRIKTLLWIGLLPAYVAVPLGVLSMLWLVYVIFGILLGTY